MEKRGLYLLITLCLVSSALAAWNVDIDDDGCVDQTDYDAVESRYGGTGQSDYDVNLDKYVDQRDLDIIQSYLDRGINAIDCDGFKCVAEVCNAEDDDCDGNVDEDKNMCGDKETCRLGECVMIAGKCFDSDGYDIYEQGNALGATEDGIPIQKDESCYEADIYNKLRQMQQCYGEDCYLLEYSCDDHDNILQDQLQCKYGCRFGKCRNLTNRCIEEDHGLDIFRNGVGTFALENGSVIDLADICKDNDNNGVFETLIEHECLEDFDTVTNTLVEEYVTYEITCGCEFGKCTNVVERACVDTDGNEKYIRGYTSGALIDGEEISDFDFCMEKVGKEFTKADRCAGVECHVTEYSCDPADQVVKYIHECPLGCVDGLCVGTECGKKEYFTINEGSSLAYDAKCEIQPEKPTDVLDLPSHELNNMKDFACCSGSSEAYCVYNNVCYPSSKATNFYEFEGEQVVCGCSDASCTFEDGNHIGLWFDMDSSQDICEGGSSICNMRWYPETGFRWIRPGESQEQVEKVWEYEDGNVECCGDDSGEYVVCQGENCICCNSNNDLYNNGECVTDKTHVGETPVLEKKEEPVEPLSGEPNEEPSETPPEVTPEPSPTVEVRNKSSLKNPWIAIPIILGLVAIVVILTLGRKAAQPPEEP